ncbi:MAG: hypothetical protein JO022_11845, partial [Acidobacteriaceae bacterium]|nr:hypothetical protein [Acidobacteriaceae bacterium]
MRRAGALVFAVMTAWGADTWNREAGEMAAKSPMVQDAKAFLVEQAKTISD